MPSPPDYHWLAALFTTSSVGSSIFSMSVMCSRPFQIHLKFAVELMKGFCPADLALFDLIQLLFHPRRIFDVKNIREALHQNVTDHEAKFSRRKLPFLLQDIFAVLNRRQNGGVGRWSSDTLSLPAP